MSLIPGLFPSPLRYPGGKGKIAPYIKSLLLDNDLIGIDYGEPYAGGASVALSLLYEDYADTIHINDLNRGVYSFWRSALENTDELCGMILDTPLTMDEWHIQRDISRTANSSTMSLGFATFYMNRTNRSGIIGGGVVGGKSQSGYWKLDARFNRDDLVQRVQKVGRHSSRIALTNLDAVDFLKSWSGKGLSSGSFIYLDPPYFVKGRGLYDNYYDPQDHAAVAKVVGSLSCPWLVSYDAAAEIVELYGKYPSIRYSLRYSAAERGQGSEIMVFSPELLIPSELPNSVRNPDVLNRRKSRELASVL